MKKRLIACALGMGLIAAFSCNKKEDSVNQFKIKGVSGTALAAGPPAAYGCFTIINVASNRALEVRGDTTLLRAQSSPKNVQQYTSFDSGYGTAQNQKWYLIQQISGAIDGSTPFKIMNVASGLYLEAPDGNNGTQLYTDHANGYPSQVWYLKQVGSTNNYNIQNANGLVLTNYGGSANDGAPISLINQANNNTQYWTLNKIAAEAYRDDQVVQYFLRTSGSIAFDQGSSIPLSYGANSGKVLWVAEDTYSDNNGGWQPATRSYPCGQFFDVRNSALLQPANHSFDQSQTSNLLTHNSTYKYEILPSPDPNDHGGTYTWPGVGIEVNNHVYMYAHEGGKSFNSTVLYDFTENTSGADWGTAVRHTVSGLSDQTAVDYPTGMVKPGDGYVYAYGNMSDSYGGKYLEVARFSVNTPFSWTFWNGTAWAASPSTASAAQLGVNGGGSKSVLSNNSVSFVNGKYVLVEMDFGYGCPAPNSAQNIYISTSASPTGPFKARQKVYAISDKINGVLCNHYVTNIHPEFNNAHNELLVTYCLNFTGCSGVSTCTNGRTDPYYYELKAVRIPYTIPGL